MCHHNQLLKLAGAAHQPVRGVPETATTGSSTGLVPGTEQVYSATQREQHRIHHRIAIREWRGKKMPKNGSIDKALTLYRKIYIGSQPTLNQTWQKQTYCTG